MNRINNVFTRVLSRLNESKTIKKLLFQPLKLKDSQRFNIFIERFSTIFLEPLSKKQAFY